MGSCGRKVGQSEDGKVTTNWLRKLAQLYLLLGHKEQWE